LRRASGVLLLSLLFALPVAGQGTALARVDAATLREVQPVLDAATRDSLPIAAIESKILEGVAKRVQPAQIGAVVRELADELRVARGALREELPGRPIVDGEVVAVAMASRQGVGRDVLRVLLESSPAGGSLEIPVTVLGELVRRGVSPEDASSAISEVVRAGVPMHIAAQIPGRMDGARGRPDAPPGQALAEALRALNIPGPPSGRGRGRP
jgi:hypothetical protein